MTSRRRTVLIALVAVGLIAAAGLAWFQPWKLWVDERVDEQLPAVALVDEPAPTRTSTTPMTRPTATPTTEPTMKPPGATRDVVLSRGALISHEHPTSGTASVVRLADGRRVLTLADLDTSNGPDVEVWLSAAPVVHGERGWYLADDGAFRSLGDLKGNLGNQVYEIPVDVDLTRLTSVHLWCARFDVSFGAAELAPV